MKKFLFCCALFLVSTSIFSQKVPIKKDKEAVKKHNIKTVEVTYHSITDLSYLNGLKIYILDFDSNANITYEKRFYLFDLVLYCVEKYSTYDEKGLLIKKTEVFTDFPKNKKDSLISESREKGSASKWEYFYNDKDLLVKELEYINEEDANPVRETLYEYNESGKKTKSVQMVIHNSENKGTNDRTENFTYNEKGLLTKREIKYSYFIKHEIYDYNHKDKMKAHSLYENNRIKKKYVYSYYRCGKLKILKFYNKDMKNWSKRVHYKYNKNLKAIKEITFSLKDKYLETYSYFDNGLKQEEVWYDKNKQAAIKFKFSYK